jgi:hypothetical protein
MKILFYSSLLHGSKTWTINAEDKPRMAAAHINLQKRLYSKTYMDTTKKETRYFRRTKV